MPNGLELTPDQLAAAVRGPQPQLMVAAPINDVQLVALIAGKLCAGNRGLQPAAAVESAIEIVGESIVQMQTSSVAMAVDRARKRLALLNGVGPRQ